MKERRLEPKRRFKEFKNAGAWELRKLGEVAIIRTGYPFDSNQFNDSGEYLVITNGNIQDNSDTVDNSFGNHVSIEDGNILREYLLNIDDILVTMDGTVGRTAKVAEEGQILAQRVGRITSNEDVEFLYQWLSTGTFSKAMSDISNGGTIKHISLDEIRSFISLIPESIKEKKQIGNFFRNLDHLITLHQRKCDKLKNIKKAMLEKMFPKKDKNIPEIRFKGFTDAWELRKLGELGSVAMNRRIFKGQTAEFGEVPFYKIGTFGGEPDAFITRELFEEYKAKYQYPKVGDILISASGSIGRTIVYTGRDEYFQDSNIVWLRHDDLLDNSFLKHFYSIVKWQGLEGSTIKRLYNKNILDTKINVPLSDEQKKVGVFFNDLDRLITLHQRKLDKLKNVKKAYLNEMFV